MSAELELGMRVDALIVKFPEEEGTSIGCSRWIRKNRDLGELKVLAKLRRRLEWKFKHTPTKARARLPQA